MEKCPKCNQQSFIKTPGHRVMRESLGEMIHTSSTHSFVCHNKDCKHTSGEISINTEMGDRFKKPWWKRIL